MRGSSVLFVRLFLGTMLVAAGARCSRRTLVVVDPTPCGEAGASSCASGLMDDLVGFWRLNDAPGSATARDVSVWANDGTLVGLDPATAWIADGPEGGALSIEGKGYVNVPASPSIDSITMQVTMAAWMYIDGTITDYATAISRQIGTGYEQHYHLSINAQQLPAVFIDTPASGQTFFPGPAPVPQKVWVHLAATYDGAIVRLYVNGAQVANHAAHGPFAAETNPVVLSGNANAAAQTVSERVPGRLDDVMLYRRALSADEIARIYGGALLAPGGSPGDGGPGQ